MRVGEYREDLIQRVRRLHAAFLVVLALVAAAYWLIQITHGSRYRELAENNRLRKLAVRAPRGLIYDRRERLLVENVPSYNLLLDRSRSPDLDGSLRFAARILDRPLGELQTVVDRYGGTPRFAPVLIAEDLSLSEVAGFGVKTLEHPEFEIGVSQLRLYRHGRQTAHALGYLGEVSEAELARDGNGLRPGDLVGKKGIEQAFDPRLRGRDGERVVVVDSRGRLREQYGRRPAEAGQSLKLTLDLELQQEAERYFAERVGAAVALDPRDGSILVLVSAPSFNPNRFARRLARSEWQALLRSPHQPLQNRAIQNAYPPGSVFKIVLAAAALGEGVLDRSDAAYCAGGATLYNRRFRCWKRGGHGWVNLRKAIKESCDVYFYHLGQKLGIERIAHYARRLGLGRVTGIEIQGEKAGLVPDPAWSVEARGSPWYPGETISVSIGQGPVLVTPLQVARLMAAVANGGDLVTPHLMAAGSSPERTPTGIDPSVLAPLREALWAVVNERGTGGAARVPGLEVAGKTGTVQVVEESAWTDSEELPFERRDHAWFASFAPAEEPELVVVVFVEHGGKGSRAAAPLAKVLYEIYFKSRLDQRQL